MVKAKRKRKPKKESWREIRQRQRRTKLLVLNRRLLRISRKVEFAEARDQYWFEKWDRTPIIHKKWRIIYDKRLMAKRELNELMEELNEVQELLAIERKRK